MKINVYIEKTAQKSSVKCTGNTVQDLLVQLQLNPETVLVVRNSDVLTRDVLLQEKDSITILSVISGG